MIRRSPRFQTNPPRPDDGWTNNPPTLRLQIQSLGNSDQAASAGEDASGSEADDLATCVVYDGTTAGTTTIIVSLIANHAVDDVIYAHMPIGGSGRSMSGIPVGWVEMGGPPGVFVVALTQDGGGSGDNGDGTGETAFWTYTCKSLSGGQTYGTNMAPQWRLPFSAGAATMGLGYFDASGNFQLLQAYETVLGSECDADASDGGSGD